MLFENVYVGKDVAHSERVSTYIASWTSAGGTLRTTTDQRDFEKWLKSLDLSDKEVDYVMNIALNDAAWMTVGAMMFIEKQNAKREKQREYNQRRKEKLNNK